MWYGASVQEQLPIEGLSFNFMPSWWGRSFGIEYGERMVFDPAYRLEAWRQMERSLHGRFAPLHLGSADPRPRVIAPDWHNAVTPAAAGCQIEYPADNYPVSHHLGAEEIAKLRVPPDITAIFPYREIIRQVKEENRRLGMDERPVLPLRGVANDASLLRGAELFADIIEDLHRARHLLDWCHGISRGIGQYNGGGGCIANCCVMMMSPQTYEEVFLGYDQITCEDSVRLGQRGTGVHHCGTFDRYTDAYRKLRSLSWIEIGMDSDIALAMRSFPDADTVSFILDPYLMLRGTAREVAARVAAALEGARGHWRRFHLSVPDIEFGTPDENLVAVYETIRGAA